MNTEEMKIKPQTPSLKRGSSTYKLIVPKKVEEQIRYLIRKFPHTEWSGILFYTHTGTFENNDLVITCKDIFPMDLGTSGWTEYKMSPEVAGYMGENLDLFDCNMGLVHSHHTLGAFFSGQDLETLRSEGNDTNCFVSLIVDTKGTYVAAVTRKLQVKSEVTVKNLGQSYEFFGAGEVSVSKNGTETTNVIDNTVIEYFDLTVEREEVENHLDYLDRRFEEIEDNKRRAEEARKKANPFNNLSKPARELTFWDNVSDDTIWGKSLKKTDSIKPDKGLYTPDKKLIHAAVCKMITCSLTLTVEKFDTKQWIKKHMKKVYNKIFQTYDSFQAWSEFVVEYTVYNFSDPKAPEEMDYNEHCGIIADSMLDELYEYSGENEYIDHYIQLLEQYLF